MTVVADPYAPLKDNAWRDIERVDALLAKGEIDEEGWHREMAAIVVPAYLGAETPWEQSGKSGGADDWEYARSHVVHAFDRDGTFLDVGCANGYLMETAARWSRFAIEPYGVDIAPELAELARRRLPHWADRIWVGNALTWEPPRRFSFVRAWLEYVPKHRRRELLERLLAFCDRLIVGVFNEHESERTTEEALRSWGFRIAGRSERAHRRNLGMEYRVLWIDA